MLLAIAWTNDEARRKLDMYPEFMGGDDTEETNSEDRPLYTLMGKDNNNLSFGHTWCFMPSKAMWVFRWIFEHAVPLLHPGTAMKRVEVIASDADAQETRGPSKVLLVWVLITPNHIPRPNIVTVLFTRLTGT